MNDFTEGTKAVVFSGESFVEITDTSVTLQDVCEAFGIAYGSDVYARDRATGRPVATLPFDPIYSPHSGGERTSAEVDDEEVVVLDLVSQQAGDSGSPASVVQAPVAAAADLDAPVTETGSAVEGAGGVLTSGRASAAVGAEATEVDVAMRELVRIGAVELLSADSDVVPTPSSLYDTQAAPGLLRRTVYPASCYSPYRMLRDPLLGSSTTGTLLADATHAPHDRALTGSFQKDGAPYTSSLDVYGADLVEEEDLWALVGGAGSEDRDERLAAVLLRLRPDLVPLSEEHAAHIFS